MANAHLFNTDVLEELLYAVDAEELCATAWSSDMTFLCEITNVDTAAWGDGNRMTRAKRLSCGGGFISLAE